MRLGATTALEGLELPIRQALPKTTDCESVGTKTDHETRTRKTLLLFSQFVSSTRSTHVENSDLPASSLNWKNVRDSQTEPQTYTG
jgi:hypothetical protein